MDGKDLMALRKFFNMNAQEMADSLGVSQGYIKNIESGSCEFTLKLSNRVKEVIFNDAFEDRLNYFKEMRDHVMKL